jgi:hypothetical protein
MAVEFKSASYEFLETLDVSAEKIAALKAKQIGLTIGFYGLKFVSPTAELKSISLPKSTNAIVKKQVPDAVLAGIKSMVNKAVDEVLGVEPSMSEVIKQAKTADMAVLMEGAVKAGLSSAGAPQSIAEQVGAAIAAKFDAEIAAEPVTEQSTKKKATKTTPPTTAPKEGPSFVVGGQILDPAKIKKILDESPVKLSAANRLYQPVHGSSKGSRYFVVGVSPDIVVAVRVDGHQVSVRVEGAKLGNYAKALASLGVHAKGEYASGHFACENTNPQRLVGAILFSLGAMWVTPIPNMTLLQGVK